MQRAQVGISQNLHPGHFTHDTTKMASSTASVFAGRLRAGSEKYGSVDADGNKVEVRLLRLNFLLVAEFSITVPVFNAKHYFFLKS